MRIHTLRFRRRALTVATALVALAALAGALPVVAQPIMVDVQPQDVRTLLVRFNEAVDPASGGTASNYLVFETASPGTRITVTSAVVAGTDVTLGLASDLFNGRDYTLRSQNIQAAGGGAASGVQSLSFIFSDGSVSTIRSVQENAAALEGQSVTVEGVVYIPSTFLQPGSGNFSAYIQDDSGRGINVFGFSDDVLAASPALQTIGNRVRVTGSVTLFGSTVEIASLTEVALIETGAPVPAPQTLTAAAANDAQWEGTFIQVTGTVQSSSAGGPGVNYVVQDGTGTIVVRVLDALGASVANAGDTVTARGAGSAFQGTFQVLVGQASDFVVTPGGGGGDVTPIAEVQQNATALEGQSVTIEGVVYIPSDFLQPNSSNWSCYIQDESGRGVNVFGFADDPLASDPMLQQVGNRVRLTGTVTLFFTTVEIADLTSLTLVAAGTTPPPAQPLSTADANDARWEGTYIQVTGTVQSSSRGGPGTNYVVDDGSGSIVVRVLDSVPALVPNTGDLITARGAGSRFQDTFQISVGRVEDLFLGEDTEDRAPPRVLAAFRSGDAELTVQFDEALDPTSATDPAHFTVASPTGPARSVSVAALVDAQTVLLSLDADIDLDENYELTVQGVADLAGNAITLLVVPIGDPPREEADLDGPARTFLPRLGERYPLTITLPASLFAGQSLAAEVQLRIFDLQGRLEASLYDSRFDGVDDFLDDNQATVVWDGRDDYAELVPAGAYVAHLLIVDERDGRTHELQLPVVVASRLD